MNDGWLFAVTISYSSPKPVTAGFRGRFDEKSALRLNHQHQKACHIGGELPCSAASANSSSKSPSSSTSIITPLLSDGIEPRARRSGDLVRRRIIPAAHEELNVPA
jgi:hypothetical protein